MFILHDNLKSTLSYFSVLFTILFTSTTLGDEQSQEVQEAFGRELREAGRKPGIVSRKDTNSSETRKRKTERRVKKQTKEKLKCKERKKQL